MKSSSASHTSSLTSLYHLRAAFQGAQRSFTISRLHELVLSSFLFPSACSSSEPTRNAVVLPPPSRWTSRTRSQAIVSGREKQRRTPCEPQRNLCVETSRRLANQASHTSVLVPWDVLRASWPAAATSRVAMTRSSAGPTLPATTTYCEHSC